MPLQQTLRTASPPSLLSRYTPIYTYTATPAACALWRFLLKACRTLVDESKEFGSAAPGDTYHPGLPLPVPPFRPEAARTIAILATLYDRYGELNDRWNAYQYYLSKGNESLAASLGKEVDTRWNALRTYMRNLNVPAEVNRTAYDELSTYCPP